MPTLIRRPKGHGNRHAARGIPKTSLNRYWTQVVCCASGPSFTAEQALLIRHAQPAWRVIAVNTSWQRVPTADILYAGDRSWWELYLPQIREQGLEMGFAGECWTVNRALAHQAGIHLVEQSDEPGLSHVAGRIHTGGNSGYAAMGLAYMLGAKRIILVGYDFQDSLGMAHWHGHHPPQLNQDRPYQGWLEKIPALVEGLQGDGVEVINCSTHTAIPAEVIARGDLAECLSLSAQPSPQPVLPL